MHNSLANWRKLRLALTLLLVLSLNALNAFAAASRNQEPAAGALTPLQLKIEKQRQRLSSGDVEERREALTQLGAIHYPGASRAAVAGLTDPAPIVRATAASAVLSLPADEAVQNIVPLLSDKDEFVRQQAAYALGKTRSRAAVSALITALGDKEDSVRGAAVVSLGQIRDSSAVVSLAVLLDPQSASALGKKAKKVKREQNVFVLRAAARSLGQIKDPAGVPALIAVLRDEKAESDVRREAAFALGEIRDASAIPALRSAETSLDPYLSHAAQEALGKILVRRLATVVEGTYQPAIQ